jgi:ABC-type multidrug transport system ATPase subunit
MDPVARRKMWDAIAAVQVGRAIVLTTHVMEECEALCSRVGILVGGRLKCIGTVAHLKARHGKGFMIEVRCPRRQGAGDDDERKRQATGASSATAVASAHEELLKLPGARLEESHAHGTFLRFSLARDSADLALTFGRLDTLKQSGAILQSSVSQDSLDQVFVGFAQEQSEERGRIAGLAYNEPA